MLYFAYGSNVWQRRIEERLGTCRRVGTAWMDEHLLRFHKDGCDGSGKCNIEPTGGAEHRIYGVVFEISEQQKRRLDLFEGPDYSTYEILAQSDVGQLEALAYRALARAINPAAAPFTWYKALVLKGALEAGFPEHYVERIRAVEAVPDPDGRRHELHFALLGGAFPVEEL